MTTPSEPSLVQLWLHGGLDLSEQLQKEAPSARRRTTTAAPPPAGYGPVQPGRPPLPAAV